MRRRKKGSGCIVVNKNAGVLRAWIGQEWRLFGGRADVENRAGVSRSKPEPDDATRRKREGRGSLTVRVTQEVPFWGARQPFYAGLRPQRYIGLGCTHTEQRQSGICCQMVQMRCSLVSGIT